MSFRVVPPKRGQVSVSATYTVRDSDTTVIATSGTFTATLPTAVGRKGIRKDINNQGAGTVTIACNGAETINGSATVAITQYQSRTLESDGSNWIII